MDLTNFLYDKIGNKKKNISRIEKDYFRVINENMINKSSKRIDDIKVRIKNDISKNIFNKKYQIKSIFEYKIIKDFCQSLDINYYELCWCNDDNDLKMNKLKKIIEGNYYCCRDCDSPMTFINGKTNVLYCYFNDKRKYKF